jgi:hypothetical protein
MTQINGYEIVGRMPLFTRENQALVRSGAKTQTRRVMKPQPHNSWKLATVLLDGQAVFDEPYGYDVHYIKCPYGHVGDIRVMPEPLIKGDDNYTYYKDDNCPVLVDNMRFGWYWKNGVLSSMFMPVWAGRVLVRYTRIWVERLQDISEADAKAEGAEFLRASFGLRSGERITGNRFGFYVLWNSINGKKYP